MILIKAIFAEMAINIGIYQVDKPYKIFGQHTRVLVLIVYAQKPLINTYADISSQTRGLNFDLHLHLHQYFVYANSESTGESADSPELLLYDNAKSTKILRASSNLCRISADSYLFWFNEFKLEPSTCPGNESCVGRVIQQRH